jgi:hypothetical protein
MWRSFSVLTGPRRFDILLAGLARVKRDLFVPVPVDALNAANWGEDPLLLASDTASA